MDNKSQREQVRPDCIPGVTEREESLKKVQIEEASSGIRFVRIVGTNSPEKCGMCGKLTDELYYHYLIKPFPQWRELYFSPHGDSPFLCPHCAHDGTKHGDMICHDWGGASCVITTQPLKEGWRTVENEPDSFG